MRWCSWLCAGDLCELRLFRCGCGRVWRFRGNAFRNIVSKLQKKNTNNKASFQAIGRSAVLCLVSEWWGLCDASPWAVVLSSTLSEVRPHLPTPIANERERESEFVQTKRERTHFYHHLRNIKVRICGFHHARSTTFTTVVLHQSNDFCQRQVIGRRIVGVLCLEKEFSMFKGFNNRKVYGFDFFANKYCMSTIYKSSLVPLQRHTLSEQPPTLTNARELLRCAPLAQHIGAIGVKYRSAHTHQHR